RWWECCRRSCSSSSSSPSGCPTSCCRPASEVANDEAVDSPRDAGPGRYRTGRATSPATATNCAEEPYIQSLGERGEMADAQDLGSCPERGVGSTPTVRISAESPRRQHGHEGEDEAVQGRARVAAEHSESPLREEHGPPQGHQVVRRREEARLRKRQAPVSERYGGDRRRARRDRPRPQEGRVHLRRLLGGKPQGPQKPLL